MLFQSLDDKKGCVGIYAEGQIYKKQPPEGITKSWSYSPYLKGLDIQYANLYCEGKTLNEMCPDHLRDEWTVVNKKLKAFMNSFYEAQISLDDNCFFDLTPQKFLKHYCELKNRISKHVFETHEKPLEYDFYRRMTELIADVKDRELNLDIDPANSELDEEQTQDFYKKLVHINKHIDYKLFGSITGRLSTSKNSFPIHNFAKQHRFVIKPQNDWFVSFDVNAAELRSAIGLLRKAQPEGDLYEWLSKDIFDSELTRTQAKETAISWLYNSSNPVKPEHAEKLNQIFEKEKLKEKYFENGFVNTEFNRHIATDNHHCISYLNQSTFIDIFHRQVIKVDDFLSDKKTFVAWLLHDELVLDVSEDDKDKLKDIVKILQDTSYGKFFVTVKVGRDYGNMKKITLKK